MKIKTKKQLNLPQLIEWLWDNDIRSRQIRADQDISAVFINKFGDVYITDDVKRDDTFTVTTEEEITEDTVLSKLTRYTAFGFKGTKYNTSINDVKSHDSLAFYIMNDDLTMTLIWTHEKGLVE